MITGLKLAWETELTDVGKSTDRQAGDLEGVGRIRVDADGKVYRWVQNKHSAVLDAGDVVFHTYSDLLDAEKYVRDGLTADLGYMAGVVMAGEDVAVDGFCWIQIHGPHDGVDVLEPGSSAPVAGATLNGVTAQLYVTTVGAVAMNTAPKNIRYIELLTVTGTTSAVVKTDCFIQCWR